MVTKAKKKPEPKKAAKAKPAKAAKKASVVKANKAKHLHDAIGDLRKKRRELNSASLAWAEAHARAGELKKTMEKKQAELNGIVSDIDAIESGNYTPALPFRDVVESKNKKGKGKKGKGKKSDTPAPAEPEAWRNVTLAELGILGKLGETLEEAGIKTLGGIADHSKDGKPLTTIKGVGEAAEKIINEATDKYWNEHPPAEPKKPESETAAEGEGTLPAAGTVFDKQAAKTDGAKSEAGNTATAAK